MIKMDDREKILIQYIKGKDVLDIGAADLRSGRFLHKFLHDNAKKVIGIELFKSKAEPLIKQGYDIRIGNAETARLKERFDVITAGDLIEHLDNPGLFLANMKRHLKPKGLLIINTPNIYAINLTLRGILMLGKVGQFYEHSMGFNEQLLEELFRRHGFQIIRTEYFNYNEKGIRNLMLRSFSKPVRRWRENILIVATPRSK
jgi:2-polyprenyl-3-methyl-5-hydroxy-6-metoxy-1,4-benzoquinol methylase